MSNCQPHRPRNHRSTFENLEDRRLLACCPVNFSAVSVPDGGTLLIGGITADQPEVPLATASTGINDADNRPPLRNAAVDVWEHAYWRQLPHESPDECAHRNIAAVDAVMADLDAWPLEPQAALSALII